MGDDHTPADRRFEPVLPSNISSGDAGVEVSNHRQRIQQYLAHEARNHINQLLIGHPHHSASLTEFDYFIPTSRTTIRNQLNNLVRHEILDQYHLLKEREHDLPATFWSFTPFGIRLLDEMGHLAALPVLRPMHDATEKSPTVRRHQDAPRPALPPTVTNYLEYEEPAPEDYQSSAWTEERATDAFSKPLWSGTSDYERPEEGRTLDELF